MKKVLLTVAALLALSMAFVGCNNNTNDESGSDTEKEDETSAVEYTKDIVIATNNDYETGKFSNYQVCVETLPDATLKAGEEYTVTLKATASRAITEIKSNFVDNTADAGWWNVLNNPSDRSVFSAETATTEIEGTATYTIAKDATAAGAAKWVIYVNGTADDGEITLTNVKATFTKK